MRAIDIARLVFGIGGKLHAINEDLTRGLICAQYAKVSFYTDVASTPTRANAARWVSSLSKGRAMDNIMVERLWRTVKYEDIYIRDYESVTELVAGLKRYFSFYNDERPHQSFGGMTPAYY